MKKWLQNWLGINPDLEQERYIATQAQLAQLARGLGELTKVSETLTYTTEKLAGQIKLDSDAIGDIKDVLEYVSKDVYDIKVANRDKASPKANPKANNGSAKKA